MHLQMHRHKSAILSETTEKKEAQNLSLVFNFVFYLRSSGIKVCVAPANLHCDCLRGVGLSYLSPAAKPHFNKIAKNT